MARGPVISVTITADDKTSGGFRSATANVEGFGSKLSAGAVAVGTFAGNVIASALPAAIDFGKELFTLGQTAEIMGRKADTVFGTSSGDIKSWADRVNESFGLSDEAVVGMAASMGDLLVPMGFTRKEASKMTKDTVGAAAALSAWSGGMYDAAEVSDILTKAMLGEREQLKSLGISINQAEVDQRALAIATAAGRREVTAMDKAIATQQLILEKSADAQTAWNDGTMDSVKAQNEAKAAWGDAKQELAEGLLPIVQGFVLWMTESLIPTIKSVIATFKEEWPEIKAAVEPVLNWFKETVEAVWVIVSNIWDIYGQTILDFTKDVFGPILQVIEGTMYIIKGVIDVVLGLLTGDWSRAWNGIKDIVSGVWKVIDGIVNAAIALVKFNIGIFLDTLGALFTAAWEGIKSVVSGGIDAIVDFSTALPGRMVGVFDGMFDGIKDAFRAAVNWVIDGWNGLKFSLPEVDTHIPGVGKIGGWSINTPNIPRLHDGGIVPGLPGSETLALLQAGERVIPAGIASGSSNVVVQIEGKTLFRMMWDETERQTRNGWRPGPGVRRVLGG